MVVVCIQLALSLFFFSFVWRGLHPYSASFSILGPPKLNTHCKCKSGDGLVDQVVVCIQLALSLFFFSFVWRGLHPYSASFSILGPPKLNTHCKCKSGGWACRPGCCLHTVSLIFVLFFFCLERPAPILCFIFHIRPT